MPLKLAGVNAFRVFELLGLFVNCPSTLEKNFWEIGSQLPKYFEGAFGIYTIARMPKIVAPPSFISGSFFPPLGRLKQLSKMRFNLHCFAFW